MVSLLDLPNEIICTLFNYTETPLDYYRLCMVHPLLYDIGCSFNTRYAFLSRTLIEDEHYHVGNDHKPYSHIYYSNKNNQRHHNHVDDADILHQQELTRSTLCRFLASSPIPLSSIYALSLLELVPTAHFCQFADYRNASTKKALLQVFSRAQSDRQQPRTITASPTRALTIPTLVNKTFVASAKTCSRHRGMNGAPRRVYYHVTLQNTMPLTYDNDDITPHDEHHFMPAALVEATPPPSPLRPPTTSTCTTPAMGDTLFVLIHDTDTVVGFDQDLNCHYGRLWYEDEGILTDSSWSDLLELEEPVYQEPDYSALRPAVPAGYYDYYKTYHHRGWRPCLLQTLYNCTLKQNVRKGGLKKGDRFDCVFVYEHREDDTICLEFCQRDEQRQRWMPQGFLLFAEHHIVWTS